MMHHCSSPPPSSELRLSAEARNLGEESTGRVCVARGRELLVLSSLGEGKEGKREEGKGGGYAGLDTADKELRGAGGMDRGKPSEEQGQEMQ